MGKLTTPAEVIDRIKRLRRSGYTYSMIARECSVSEKTAKKYGSEVRVGRRGRRIPKSIALGIHHREDYEFC